MSLGWMLALGVGLLLLLAVVLVVRTSAQVGDYSLQPMQRFEISPHGTGSDGHGITRSIDVGQRKSRGVHPPAHAPNVNLLKVDSAKQTGLKPEPVPDKGGIRQVRVNGQLVYDGAATSNITLRISGATGKATAMYNQATSINSSVPMRGLVIMSEPLEKILSGKKTLELRKRNNKMRGLLP